MVGSGFMVTVNVLPVLSHPLPFVTTMVAVYVPGMTESAIGTVIGLAGKEVVPTFTKPADWAATSQVIV